MNTQGKHIKITPYFSPITLMCKENTECYISGEESKYPPRLFYPAKLVLKLDLKIEIFQDKHK